MTAARGAAPLWRFVAVVRAHLGGAGSTNGFLAAASHDAIGRVARYARASRFPLDGGVLADVAHLSCVRFALRFSA